MSALLWQFAATILVLSMQAGFLLLEAGRVRTRNIVNVAQKNISDLTICSITFLVFGYGIGFGIPSPLYTSTVTLQEVVDFLFQLAFCSTAATIVSGAVAERMRFTAYLALMAAMAILIYPLALWTVWGNALAPTRAAPLANAGFYDFAGAAVVHALAGTVALVSALMLGPRSVRQRNPTQPVPGHNPVFSILGTMVLLIGWLGFNLGSLAPDSPMFAQALINTVSSAAMGSLVGMAIGWRLDSGVFNPDRSLNGLIAGLVAITAAAPHATLAEALAISAAGAAVAVLASNWLWQRWRLDDPVDVIATHGLAGAVGIFSVAWVLPQTLLVDGSHWMQLAVQSAGLLALLTATAVTTWGVLAALRRIHPLRVSAEDERVGLNYTEHGVHISGEALRDALQTRLDDGGNFADRVDEIEDVQEDSGELAPALSTLLEKYQQSRTTVLRQAERFEQFADITNDLLWETDRDGRITDLIVGKVGSYEGLAEHAKGQPLLEVFQPGFDDWKDMTVRMQERLPLGRFEAEYRSGEAVRHLRVTGLPVFDKARNFSGYRGGATDITQERLAQDRALFLATHDDLTGLLNRRALQQQLARVKRGERFAIALIDLDGFKQINDLYGHNIGDQVLVESADRLRRQLREEDQLFRQGGDEFVVLLRGMNVTQQREAAVSWSERIVAALSEPFEIEQHQLMLGASVGISVHPTDSEDLRELLRLADLALYRAKDDGKGTVIAFKTEMEELAKHDRELQEELLRAFDNGEFILAYQPKVRLADNRLTGFEALLRWQHPTRGTLAPGAFLKTIENLGLMGRLDDFVLRTACQEAASWPDKTTHVAVNIAPEQFTKPNFIAKVKQALDGSSLPPERLEIEITEESMVCHIDQAHECLRELKDLGVAVAVDDFGCGSTSLQYLHQFPVNKLKIDKSFIRNLQQDKRAREVVRAIIALCRELGLTVTAEGVEAPGQLRELAQWSCDEMQGYLIARPLLERDEILGWFEKNAAGGEVPTKAAQR